jgi:DUF1365 family protein
MNVTAPAVGGVVPARDRASCRSSALYEGVVRHLRVEPVEHRFERPVSMVLLDLSEVDEVVDEVPVWSRGRWAPAQFRRGDYFDGTEGDLADGVRDLVEARLGRRPTGRVRMLTQLRAWGWLFNPLTVYWLDDDQDELDAVVLEVTNTPWHERHWYVVDGSGSGRFGKQLHVSPFLPMDLDYRLTAPPPGPHVDVRLEVLRAARLVFDADLRLRRVELTPASAALALIRHPLATWRVSLAIRVEALRLWLRRVPVHRHPGR